MTTWTRCATCGREEKPFEGGFHKKPADCIKAVEREAAAKFAGERYDLEIAEKERVEAVVKYCRELTAEAVIAAKYECAEMAERSIPSLEREADLVDHSGGDSGPYRGKIELLKALADQMRQPSKGGQ